MEKSTQIITPDFNEILGAFDQINDSILIIDPKTEQIINANLGASRLYGYIKEEFTGIYISDISVEPAKCKHLLYEAISGGEAKTFEVLQITKDGSELLMEMSPSLVTYNNQIAILCVGRDIRERKAIEEELRKSEEKYKMMVEGVNVITWFYDIEKRKYTFVSQVAEKLLGYPLSNWMKNDFWFSIIHPDDKEKIIKLINERISKCLDFELEYRVITSSGEVKWFKDLTSLNFSDGKPKTQQGVLIDVTDKKKTEEALKTSEEQLYLIFENAPIGNSLTTLDGHFLRVNSALCNLLGYSKEELFKMNFQQLTHPEDLKENIELLDFTLKSGNSSCQLDKRYIGKDGRIIYVSTNISILKDTNGNPYRFVAQVIDITKQKKDEEKLKATELRLSSLLNNLSDIVFYESDNNGVFVSDNIEEMLGFSPKEFSEDTGFFENLMHPDDRERINSQVKSWRVKDNPGSLNFEFRVMKKDGTYIWIEDHMFGIKSESRSYWSGFMIDITGRKIAETKLKETQTRLAYLLSNLPNVIFYESERDKVFISDNIFNIIGYTAEEIESDRKSFYMLIHPEDREQMELGEDIWKKVMATDYYKQQFRVKKKDGSYIWMEDHMYPVKIPEKEYLVGFMMNITERKITEQRLEETQMRLAAVLNNLPNVVFYENAYEKQFISENIMEMLGYPVEDFYANDRLFDSLIHKEDLGHVIKKTDNWLNSGAKGTYKEIFRIKRKDGKYIWLEDHMFKSQRQDGKNYFSGVMIDITDRKKAEDELAGSVKEKELLIKEIHHRVKNNLQVISSLLKLQSTHVTDQDALDTLLDSQNRVQSMALVHQKLYQSKDLANLDLNEYMTQLLHHLLNSIKSKSDKIKMNIAIDDIKMGVDTAIPCGLVVNELVSNALKHAFPGDSAGIIDIELKEKEKNVYVLTIKDNGAGFPDNIDYKNTSSLGLQLVITLVNQLEGNIEMHSNNGTEFIITFKEAE